MSDLSCPNCAYMSTKPAIEYDSNKGDSICTGCGQVLDQRPIDEAHDWRNFADSDQDNARAGTVDPYLGGHMMTRFVSGNGKMDQQLLREHNKSTLDTKTKNMMEASDVIAGLGTMLNLSSHIQSKAKALYYEYEQKRSAAQRKASHRPLMVAIVAIACNQAGFGRTFKELAKASGANEKDIKTHYKALMKIFNYSSPGLTAESLVPRFCSRLHEDIPEWVKIGAANIAKKASSVSEGRQPATVAAGSILLACQLAGIHVDPESIAHASMSISASTVQSAYQQLLHHRTEVVSHDYLAKIQQHRGTISSSSASSSSPSSSSSTLASSSPLSLSTANNMPSALKHVPGAIPTQFTTKPLLSNHSNPPPSAPIMIASAVVKPEPLTSQTAGKAGV